MSNIVFPKGFLWGTATSAYQIEGGYNDDGKGESIWDRFTHSSGRILNNDNGDVACDHYHLFETDIKLMKELGLTSYRLSISWARVFPDGKGKPNEKGVEFYKKLVSLLTENGIKPAVTLYHWDLPQKLEDEGGWANRKTAEYFEQYARYMFNALGDKVSFWITFNEPWVTSYVGHWLGGHPPAISNFSTALQVSHHLLLAHGLAVRAFREMKLKSEIGISLNLNPIYPASEDEKDIAAALRYGDFYNGWFLDPILKGRYPQKFVEWLSDKVSLPEIKDGDMDIIHSSIDFIGVNTYTSSCVANAPERHPLQVSFMETGKDKTDSGWEIYPEGIYDLLMYLHQEYHGIKTMITENGAAFQDSVDSDGQVKDDKRIQYLHSHIAQVHRAISEGANVTGYFAWSLLDNFEWNLGYSRRFGLIYVDYQTQKRTIKKSGYWYKKVIEDNGLKS